MLSRTLAFLALAAHADAFGLWMLGSTTPNYGPFAKIVSSCDSAPSPKPAACFLITSLDDLCACP